MVCVLGTRFLTRVLFFYRGLFDFFGEQHEQVHSDKHEGKLSHELIAGAASYEAVKAYQEHCAKNG